MSVIGSNILAGASGQAGYFLTKSLRFRSSASAYLNRTPASAGNRKTWTWSGWIKRGTIGAINNGIFSAGTSFGTNNDNIQTITFNNDTLTLVSEVSGSVQYNLVTSQVFRDPSAWYHFVLAFDTTQATSSNRIKLYVNGLQVTAFSTSTYPSLNYDGWVNSANAHRIGNRVSPDFDGYMAEVNFIDGQALTPSSFGETSTTTGVWIPKKYTGTYGTNGFYLPFTDTTSTSTLGTDFSGNSNTWTVNNISLTSGSTYDSMTDVPTNTSATVANYAVLNPLDKSGTSYIPTISNGNLSFAAGSAGQFSPCRGTQFVSSGKWYFEVTITNNGTFSGQVGVANNYNIYQSGGDNSISSSGGVGVAWDGRGFLYYTGNSVAFTPTFTTNDVISCAFDADTGKTWFRKNGGSWYDSSGGTTGDPATGANAVYTYTAGTSVASFANGVSPHTQDANFGQRPFSYTPPSGFVALNTFNLPTPTIGATASSQANKYMDVTTYTGNSTAGRVITMSNMTNVGFAWVKLRSGSDDHRLANTVTGGNKHLQSNTTAAEGTGTNIIQAFSSNTFTVGSDNSVNVSGSTYVGWVWANDGTSGSTNTQGTITSTVSANTTAGFSVVTYTGTGGTGTTTVGHGLGVAPSMVIIKRRNGTTDWASYHTGLTSTSYYLVLNSTASQANYGSTFISPSSSTLTIAADSSLLNTSTGTYVAYCFAQVAGYSAFGSYTGNGSSDGTFVFTGFRPRFLMIKASSFAGESWYLFDTARNTYNVIGEALVGNQSSAEFSFVMLDILSNGFKARTTNSLCNTSGATYIYMAFAESPFKYANAR